MRYASLDIETTGLDPLTSDVIEIGVVLEDTANPRPLADLPAFHCYVLPDPCKGTYIGDPFALSMHPTIFRRIATREEGYLYFQPEEAVEKLAEFLSENGYEYGQTKGAAKLTCAGKNFAGFDKPFLSMLPTFDVTIGIAHRVLDPGSMFVDAHDARIPDTKECCKRAGLTIDNSQAHTAIYDAQLVIAMIRKHWGIIPKPLN